MSAESADAPQPRRAELSQLTTGTTGYRGTAIDAVRVVGIVAVVVGHVWSTAFVGRLVYPWHVPVFFFLSGYLWRSNRSLTRELRHRSRSLLVPYVAWLAIIGTVYFGWLAVTSQSPTIYDIGKAGYGGSMENRPFSAFWFVTALFFATLMVRALERAHPGAAWLVAGAGLAACAIAGDKVARAPLSIGVAVPCMIFILAGSWFAGHRSLITRPLLVGLLLIAVSATMVCTGISPPLRLKYGDFGVPIVGVAVAIMISAGLLLVFEVALRSLRGAPAVVITRLAQAGLVVVLSHALVLWMLNTPTTGSFVALVVCLACSWALGLFLIHTPLSWFLAGQSRINRVESATLPAPTQDRADTP